jgi:hypothetical protein
MSKRYMTQIHDKSIRKDVKEAEEKCADSLVLSPYRQRYEANKEIR